LELTWEHPGAVLAGKWKIFGVLRGVMIFKERFLIEHQATRAANMLLDMLEKHKIK
jgi:lipid-A-disaccharide synthase-like uncharacterized protein